MHHGRRNSAGTGPFFGDEDEDEYPVPGHGDRDRSSRGGGFPVGSTSMSRTPPTRSRTGSESFGENDYKEEIEVAELLTKAAVTSNDQLKLDNLAKVKEIIVNRQPALLDNFLDEMLNFLSDAIPHVRRYILEFIEEACKTDPEIIPKILHNMLLMLNDTVVSVQKKAIQVTAKVYKMTLQWLCRAKTVTDDMESSWNYVNELKRFILKQIDSDNDGIRTHTVKFIETVILLQTPTESDTLKRANEFCLDDVPITLKVARPRKLEEDAKILFDELLKFHGSRHATSVNLMTCMGSIVLIAKLRPQFMGRVVIAIEKLNAILPPTLERSQVQSVRKHMKLQLIGLLKHPRAIDYYDNITTLLTDLGASHHDLTKAVPNWEEIRSERRKRQREILQENEDNNRKRPRLSVEEEAVKKEEPPIPMDEDYDDEDDDDDEDEDDSMPHVDEPPKKAEAHESDQIENVIFERLNPAMAADLVIAFMDRLPEKLPAHFMSAYTPIAIAGKDSQVRHVARLLSAQIIAFQHGPAVALQGISRMEQTEAPIPTLISSSSNQPQLAPPQDYPLPSLSNTKLIMGTGGKKKVLKALKLSEVTKPMSDQERQKQTLNSLKRILESSELLADVKGKLVAAIVITASHPLRDFVMQYIRDDVRHRLDLGIYWLFGEYSLCQGYLNRALPALMDSSEDRYEWTFISLMTMILDCAVECEKANLSWRLYVEPPMIPDKGVELLERLCNNEVHSGKGMELLKELTNHRPKKLHYLSIILAFCSHAVEKIRTNAVNCALNLYERGEVSKIIEDKAANTYLSSLKLQNPPEILFMEGLGRPHLEKEWTEDLAKASLHLYLRLVSVKNQLIHELAKVYVETPADVKRTILRAVEQPVRQMGMDSPELMKLVDSFPKGSETLITRIIHILTDKILPSADLVQKVRNLYNKRIFDVRFLIPVLNGLTKQEIIVALPKLIQLNPNVVKEVFNRLLGIHVDAKTQHTSPINPEELMVELHCMDITGNKCDIKSVIKATSLCFAESDIYTQDVLAKIINELIEVSPLPTLLMRTVIQTLNLHPRLVGFIMNTLGRLIKKQVWTQPKIWEGFVKCCQRTLQKSLPILLMVPHVQLRQVLEDEKDLRVATANYVMSLSEQHRSQIPPEVLEVVLNLAKRDSYQKAENYYGYDDEIMEIQNNHTFTVQSSYPLKLEPRSPRRENEVSFKTEPMEYHSNNNDD